MKKIYQACLKVRDKVRLNTGVSDFLEFTTAKARINPKY